MVAIPEFESERARLVWLTRYLVAHSHFPRELSVGTDEEAILYFVSASYQRRALIFAEGIAELLNATLVEATGPLERALWELWIGFRFLYRVGVPEKNAIKAQVNSMIEMLTALETAQPSVDEQSLRGLRSHLAAYREQYGELVDAVEAQRRRRCFHWSGCSIGEMIRRLGSHHFVYRAMSWEAHSTLTPAFDLGALEEAGDFVLNWLSDTEEHAEHIAHTAGEVLFYVWNEHSRRFGEELLELSDEPSEEEE